MRITTRGYIPDKYDGTENVYGSGQTPNPVILESGDWSIVLVGSEFQNKNGFDPFACVTYTILNAIEKLAKLQYNEEWNLSERFTYIVSDSIPGSGNSPKKVAQAIHELGTLAEKDLSYDELIDTIEKFNSPKPMSKSLLREALKFIDDYVFRYDFLPLKGVKDIEGDNEVLRDALKRSPIGIAVYAWAERNGKYFRPNPSPETHFTLLEKVDKNGEKKVFDSYAPALKTLDSEFYIATAMRFYLRKKTQEEKEAERKSAFSLLQSALNWLKEVLKLVPKEIVRTVPPVIDEVPIESLPKDKPSRIKDWAKAISECEGYKTPGAITITKNFNPGAIKNRLQTFLVFDSEAEGFAYLEDYLTRACTSKHGAYPKGGDTLLKDFTQIYVGNDFNYYEKVADKLKVEKTIKIKELL